MTISVISRQYSSSVSLEEIRNPLDDDFMMFSLVKERKRLKEIGQSVLTQCSISISPANITKLPFSTIFRGCRNGALGSNGLMGFVMLCLQESIINKIHDDERYWENITWYFIDHMNIHVLLLHLKDFVWNLSLKVFTPFLTWTNIATAVCLGSTILRNLSQISGCFLIVVWAGVGKFHILVMKFKFV